MRVLLVLPLIVGIGMHSNKKLVPIKYPSIESDSIVHHILDGSVKEWPSKMFNIHSVSNISCAIDNDAQNLFIATKVPDFMMQRKIMQEGLNVYIDLKAKKEKNNRIEFPIRSEDGFSLDALAGKTLTPQERSAIYKAGSPERKELIEGMTKLLTRMKLSGFDKKETTEQELLLDNSTNIAFNWEDDVLYIEYSIPFHVLGISSLSKNKISVGWNITAAKMPEGRLLDDPSILNTRPSGVSNQIGYQGYQPNNFSGPTHAETPANSLQIWTSEQTVWAKYICH